MAKATKTSSANAWPSEGLPISDAFFRLLPDVWKNHWQDAHTLDNEFRMLLLTRSDLTLWGRPKDPYAELIDLGTAARLIVAFTWELSVAHDIDGRRIYDVRVCRKRVELEIDPCKSGAPGRPSPMSIIEDEARQRITSGVAVVQLNGLTKFATELAEWWEQERQRYKPVPVSMQMKSIRNRVRPLWNRALLRL